MKMIRPKVSVIVPVYNAEQFLEGCIESILTQDYDNIELVLIDDGSVDHSGAICAKYAVADSRVVYRYQNNSGVSAARNHGLDICTGEYVAFVDSDDQLKPAAIRSLVRSMESTQADLCICGYEIVTKDQITPSLIGEEMVAGTENIAAYFSTHYLEAIASSVWGKLYKKELLAHRFDRSITMGEDLLFNLEYIKQVQRVQAIGEAFYLYNKQNENSLANNYKLSYYEQDLYVTRQWLSWINQFDAVDNTNLHYRISRAFFCCLLIICSADTKMEKVKKIKDMVNGNLVVAVEKTICRYNFLQKTMFRLLLHGNYRMLVNVGVMYLRLKQLRQILATG